MLPLVTVSGITAAAEEAAVPELTIWVDPASEEVIRNAMVNYKWLCQSYGAGSDFYPDLTWKLVDKSYLTPAQFRRELVQELEAGGGPDLIYMDEFNGISPQVLMESGYLLELEHITEKNLTGGEWKYLPGTLEAGQAEGKQYVLPVYVQCPVVFGAEAGLIQAGMDTENGCQSLRELLEAMIAAAEKSGKYIFENDSAVEWIETYCLPVDSGKERAKELEELLEQIRGCCGAEKGFFSPCETLNSGESLFSGCSMESIQKTAQNLGMMDGETDMAFFPVPSWDGEIRAVITQSVAVNSNTSYPAEARALAGIFQEIYVNQGVSLGKFLPACGERGYWQEVLDGSFWSTQTVYCKEGRVVSATEQTGRRFLQATLRAVTDAAYQSTEAIHREGMEDAGKPEEKKVLTVAFSDRGMGELYPVYQWLQDTADGWEDETVHIQLVPIRMENNIRQMNMRGAAADLVLCVSGMFDPEHSFPDEAGYYADLTELLEEREELRVVEADGEIKGISCGIQDSENGYDFAFSVSECSEVKAEAVAFCMTALQNENYEAAVKATGFILPEEKSDERSAAESE